MKEKRKGFISGVLTTVIALSLVGTAAATIGSRAITADYSDIKITLNGTQITPTDANGNVVEPFAVNGTTYLPVRAVANALGVDVEWDGKSSTVFLTEDNLPAKSTKNEQMLGFYKILEEGFSNLETTFDGIWSGVAQELINEVIQDGIYNGMTFYEASKERLSVMLENVESHYQGCKPYLTDKDVAMVSEYRRLNSLAISHLSSLASGNESSLAIQNIKGAAMQAYVDSISGSSEANVMFWTTYQNAFK